MVFKMTKCRVEISPCELMNLPPHKSLLYLLRDKGFPVKEDIQGCLAVDMDIVKSYSNWYDPKENVRVYEWEEK